MKGFGFLFLGLCFVLIAAYFFYTGLQAPTTVPGDAQLYPNGVANLQLMHVQMLDVVLGVGASIVAAVFFVGGAIVGSLEYRPPN